MKLAQILTALVLINATLTSCSVYTDPEQRQANAEPTATTTPVVPVAPAVEQTTAVATEDPIPSDKLWLDPVTGLYWLLGGKGSQEYMLSMCLGDYRPATYYEMLKASLDGIQNEHQNITKIWTPNIAYSDYQNGKVYFYYVDLDLGAMVAGDSNEVHSLACIWDPRN